MHLAGDVAVGGRFKPFQYHFALSEMPDKIVHSAREGRPISVIGASPPVQHHAVNRLSPFGKTDDQIRLFSNDAYVSTAKMSNFRWIRIFYDAFDGFCRGMILKYRDGAERALGQCRIGVDPCRTYLRPLWMCYLRTTSLDEGSQAQLRVVRAECSDEVNHRHYDDKWRCRVVGPLGSIIQFQFSNRETDLRITYKPREPE
jgi:hypothetical protein